MQRVTYVCDVNRLRAVKESLAEGKDSAIEACDAVAASCSGSSQDNLLVEVRVGSDVYNVCLAHAKLPLVDLLKLLMRSGWRTHTRLP